MQERSVQQLVRSHKLPHPFFVLATQNPIEQEGTYPLPEAQLDRFHVQHLGGLSEVSPTNSKSSSAPLAVLRICKCGALSR